MIEQIVKDYESGLSIRYIAKKYNKGSSTIHRWLAKHNITRNLTESWEKRGSVKLNNDNVIAEYNTGISVLQLSKKYECSRNKIQKILTTWNDKSNK